MQVPNHSSFFKAILATPEARFRLIFKAGPFVVATFDVIQLILESTDIVIQSCFPIEGI